MELIDKIFGFFRHDDIGEPPWEYDFLINLDAGLYPLYLKKIFQYRTGENLPIKRFGKDKWIIDKKRCKTFNQKIQWQKLYGSTPLMRKCTDKVEVRDYIKDKIGEEYLKPVLQICNSFDEINFGNLPNAFVMKCSHGCKWQYIIKDKEDVLNTKPFVDIIKRNMSGWIEQEFWPWEGFEMQYKGIEPRILIEPLLREERDKLQKTINVYCFKGKPKLIFVFYGNNIETIYGENFELKDKLFISQEDLVKIPVDELIKQSFDLSILLAKNFEFSRVDWMIYNNKLYFEELTFTPYSGFAQFINKEESLKFGSYIDL